MLVLRSAPYGAELRSAWQEGRSLFLRGLLGKRKRKLLSHLEDRFLALADQSRVLGQGGDQDGHGDGRIAVDRGHTRVVGDLAPALRLLEGAPGKPAPV